MKTFLLFLCAFISTSFFSQTTYNLNWQRNFTSPATDLTINVGDTVVWTWTDNFSHTVETSAGSTETFTSPVLSGLGQTYSHTFTSAGSNPYLCGIHGPASMSGTITVATLDTQDSKVLGEIAIYPNPVTDFLEISNFSSTIFKINIYDFSGRNVKSISKFEDQKRIKIGVSALEKGVYFIEIQTEKEKNSKKFIKN